MIVKTTIDSLEEQLEKEALDLLVKHGLADEGWEFVFTNHKTALGYCWDSKKQIGLSRYYLSSPREQLTDTLRHEVAHALVGCEYGHGKEWKAVARMVGAIPNRCAVGPHTNSAKFNYVIRCPECGQEWKRYRMRRRNFGSTCPDCGTKVEIYRYERGS